MNYNDRLTRMADQLHIPRAELLTHMEAGEVHCSACHKWKLGEVYFHRNKGRITGFHNLCRECRGVTKPRQRTPRGPRCGYCNRGGAREEIKLAGVVYQVHSACATRAREYVYGEPVRDPVGAE